MSDPGFPKKGLPGNLNSDLLAFSYFEEEKRR